MYRLLLLLILLPVFGAFTSCSSESKDRTNKILVFSKTEGYRHGSIADGISAIKKLGEEHGFEVDTTEDATKFTETVLSRYLAVIFLNTTGDVLNHRQQTEFERYIQAGGGYVGVHAAADTEYGWPWYGKLAGAYFESHPNDPNVREAILEVTNQDHESTKALPEKWKREDEWYNFKDINPEVNVLITIDESSYEGGTNGEDHPMAWYHQYDGGRAFYTALGHTPESYSETLFLQHLWGGINYAIGQGEQLNYKNVKTQSVPEENRFTKVVLDQNLDEPTELAVLPDGKVLFVERKGNIKLYLPGKGTKVITKLNVHTEFEDGLMGVALDPDFENNHWIYMYYSPVGTKPVQYLSRFNFEDDSLILASEKVVLEVPVQREKCCHTGGSIAFDSAGNLYLSTGDDTSPFESDGYAPIDERKGRGPFDAQKSSGNTNDLRGKILRIKPLEDGSYSIPEGNLFPRGQEKTKPEIYVMGNRNPYRISLDSKTGFLYWGEVGPDAGKDSVGRGPKGHDEVNQARKAGNFGWPYFVADNKAYWDYDFATNNYGEKFDPGAPVNASPNNTGLKKLPPAQKAFIWYPYDQSEEFPIVGKGGRNAMAGPVYYSEDYQKSDNSFPDYYDGKLFIYDWMRGWALVATMDNQGNLKSLEPFMENTEFNHPMDMAFGPDGSLYLLEYGTYWFKQNEDARLSRIEYNAGNREPVARIAANKTVGAAPLTVEFSSQGTMDYDHDSLKYEWFFTYGNRVHSNEPFPNFTYEKPGEYKPKLKVTDSEGNSTIAETTVKVGNEPPEITIVVDGNRSFFYGNNRLTYEVKVTDLEDGNLENGGIDPEAIQVNFDYLAQGFDITEIAQGHQSPDNIAGFSAGKKLIDESDCKACHAVDVTSVGPSYKAIANRYHKDEKAVDYLAGKIIQGGGGVWSSEHLMAAHPQLSPDDAKEMVKYILALTDEAQPSGLPVKGPLITDQHGKGEEEGAYILRASYTDKGGDLVGPINASKIIVLRHPRVQAENYHSSSGVDKIGFNPELNFVRISKNNAYISFDKIDLTGIKMLSCRIKAVEKGSKIEVHTGSPEGKLIGSIELKAPDEKDRWQEATIPLKDTDNVHDVYFVFSNDQGVQENLMEVDWVYFHYDTNGQPGF